MLGFMFFFLVVIAGVLGLLAGMKLLGVPFRQELHGEGPDRADLRRLEEALGALDARLERLEDQQRFLERLLEARPEPAALPPPDARPAGEGDLGVDSVLFDVDGEER